jgi:hypothetical protein
LEGPNSFPVKETHAFRSLPADFFGRSASHTVLRVGGPGHWRQDRRVVIWLEAEDVPEEKVSPSDEPSRIELRHVSVGSLMPRLVGGIKALTQMLEFANRHIARRLTWLVFLDPIREPVDVLGLGHFPTVDRWASRVERVRGRL